MNIPATDSLGLGPVNQIGFVVRDMARAIAQYQPLFGPFEEMDAPDMEWDYRGTPETSSLKIAFANSGGVEIELIEWISGKTPHKEFLDAGREGMHHLRFMVEVMEEKIEALAPLGYQPIWTKRFGAGLAAVYLERGGDPLLIELFENHHA